MVDGIVQICGTLRLQGITTQNNKQKKPLDERVVRYTGQISTDTDMFRPNLYDIPALFVSSLAINIQQDQDTSGNSSGVPLHYVGHVAQICKFSVCCALTRV